VVAECCLQISASKFWFKSLFSAVVDWQVSYSNAAEPAKGRYWVHANNLLLFSVDPNLIGYKEDKLTALYQQMFARLEAVPM
jgi:hypothetical protein